MRITHGQLRQLISEVISDTEEKTVIQSAGVIIIDGDEMLVLRAYRNWDFPKGTVDPGETLVDAATRETWEETHLVVGEDYFLTGNQAPSISYRTRKGTKEATYFLAKRIGTKDPYLPISDELGKPENDEWAWISVSELLDPSSRIQMPSRLLPVIEHVIHVISSVVKQ